MAAGRLRITGRADGDDMAFSDWPWEIVVLSWSHVLGLPALVKATAGFRVANAAVVACVLVCSTLMHLSETKHGLEPPQPWRSRSDLFLNLDRFVALFAVIYFGPDLAALILASRPVPNEASLTFWTLVETFVASTLVHIGVVSWVCSVVGEFVGRRIYLPLHFLWHAGAFYILFRLA